jgi:predicted acetyltransferase
MEIRPIKKSEFDSLMQIYVRSFFMLPERLQGFPFIHKDMDLSQTRTLFIEGQIASAFLIIPFHIWVNDKKVPMGGIAAVVTPPEFRKRGFVRTMLEKSVSDIKQMGLPVSILFARLQHMYRKFGWETASNIKEYTIHPEDISIMPETGGKVEVSGKMDVKTLMSLYETYAQSKTGMLVRNSGYWNDVVIGNKNVYLYKNPVGKAEGYFISQTIADGMVNGFGKFKLDIKEMVTLTHGARTGIFSFLKQLLPQIQTITFKAPVDDLSSSYFSSTDINIGISRGYMLRVTDIKSAFAAKSYPEDIRGQVIFTVEDRVASWNNGTFSMQIEDGKAEVRKSTKPGLFSCNINTLSQLFSGYLDLNQAYSIGAIQCSSPKKLVEANALFKASTPFMNDFF